jgi:hypothetical protein
VKPQRLSVRRPVSAIDVRPFRFERRVEGRQESSGEAMAAFYDEDGALSLTRVTLVDESVHGLGLVSPVAVEPGVRFGLHARGRVLAHTTGVVARCSPKGEVWSVGLRCDPRRAA